jgi:hypothetical protein
MDDSKVPLSQLIAIAKSADQLKAEQTSLVVIPQHTSHRIRKEMRARLVAQEFVRNGMDFVEAWRTVTGMKTLPNNASMLKALGSQMDIFVDELSHIVHKSDIDRDRTLSILYGMVNTSILDFMDDKGDILAVSELKKLPRVMQLMISEIEVFNAEGTVKDGKGNPVLDDNGSPYVVRSQKVKIKIPERLAAINQLAQIMRWIGPTVALNVQVNIGRMMSEADERATRATMLYDQATTNR